MDNIKKIIVGEYCDGFSVDVFFHEGKTRTFSFDQEDNKKEMINLFKLLGVDNVKYVEVA